MLLYSSGLYRSISTFIEVSKAQRKETLYQNDRKSFLNYVKGTKYKPLYSVTKTTSVRDLRKIGNQINQQKKRKNIK